MKTENTTESKAELIVSSFYKLAYSRSAVRLDWANYWTGDRQSSIEAYRQDRNNIRRATRAIEKVACRIKWRNNEAQAKALLEAARGSRLSYFGDKDGWQYTPGQYAPTEIRWACARLLESAERILKTL